MTHANIQRIRFVGIALLLMAMTSCTPLIGPYSPRAYEYATGLKAEALGLMTRANEPFDAHREQVERLQIEMQKAYEFVRGIESNDLSARQWQKLIDPQGDLMGKFILRWQQQGKINEPFLGEFRKIISDAFDEIICLEANKQSPQKCLGE